VITLAVTGLTLTLIATILLGDVLRYGVPPQ
jgi:hypothetical protein